MLSGSRAAALLAAFTTLTSAAAIPRNSTLIERQDRQLGELCDIRKTTDVFLEFGVGNFLFDEVERLFPFEQSFHDTLIGLSPSLVDSDYTCTIDNPCSIDGALDDACLENPQAITALISVANFVNVFRNIMEVIDDVVQSIDGKAAQMVLNFNPSLEGTQEIPDNGQADNAGLTLTMLGALAGIAPGLQAVGAGLTIAGAAVPVIAGQDPEPALEAQFNQFADITNAVSAVRDELTRGIATFVDQKLNEVPPSVDEYISDDQSLLLQIKDGIYAEPGEDIAGLMSDPLEAILSAPAINKMWNNERVFIAKVSSAAFSGNVDPCDGDTLFTANNKFCDENGVAYIMQSFPADLDFSTALDLASSDQFAVPGFGQIADHKLDLRTIALASERNQAAGGIGSIPADDDLLGRITGSQGLPLEDTAFFNLPVCDLDQMNIGCISSRFSSDTARCEFNTRILCGCPTLDFGERGWPFPTNDNLGDLNSIQCLLF